MPGPIDEQPIIAKKSTPKNGDNDYKQKRKTEPCKNFAKGKCNYGDDCAFAHGVDELRKKSHVASRYKLAQCQSYHGGRFYCQYGQRCQFAHL